MPAFLFDSFFVFVYCQIQSLTLSEIIFPYSQAGPTVREIVRHFTVLMAVEQKQQWIVNEMQQLPV